jgi:hypothetical protein
MTSGVAVLAGVMGLAPLAEAGNRGLSPIVNSSKNIGTNPYYVSPTAKQNSLDRIADVLSALGVPKNGGSHYWLDSHFNHFHLNIRRPTQTPVDILASNNLTATGPVLADAGTSITTTAQKEKYDAAFSVCGAAVPTTHRDFSIANRLSPLSVIDTYLYYEKGIPYDSNRPVKVTVIENPAHGRLVPDTDFPDTTFVYHPNEGYLGPDQITFVVEEMGKKFKVIETVWVANTAPEYGGCPTDYKLPPATTGNDKRGALDVIELPVDGTLDTDALAKLHAFVSFATGAGLSGDGSMFNLADLPGAAIGQTTGSTITLDTNAAGYNWFIDTTPADNSEFLPTSNPNEWVAKAGSAAAGKMDMLSVLLHEYGHALGMDHSANPNDLLRSRLAYAAYPLQTNWR